jgi:hypothetical protein
MIAFEEIEGIWGRRRGVLSGFYLGRNSNRATQGYKSQVLPLQTTCSVIVRIKQTPLYLKISSISLSPARSASHSAHVTAQLVKKSTVLVI